MAILEIKRKTYTDVAYVEGVFNHQDKVERALYNHCKQYFDENYRGVFFVEDAYKDEIFHNSFVILWENIINQKIYVEEGVLKGKDGKPFSGALTTYFMSIARIQNFEVARQEKKKMSKDLEDHRLHKVEQEQYETLLYDSNDVTMLEIIADSISHMSKRCNQILTMFYYEEKTLDAIMNEIPDITSKDALKTRKYKCMEELRKSANSIYRRYLNS